MTDRQTTSNILNTIRTDTNTVVTQTIEKESNIPHTENVSTV